MGFFSEIINDCTSTRGSIVSSGIAPSTVVAKSDSLGSHNFPFANSIDDISNVNDTESLPNSFPFADIPNDQKDINNTNSVPRHSEETFYRSDVGVTNHEFNNAVDKSDDIDLAAELHRVQAERLHMQSRARSNVPCSEESQVINREGGDSEEHLHDDNVNRSSIDQKQKSDAEKVRDRMFDSEFFESSSDVREFDEDVNNSRYDSDESFYDRKVELNSNQISSRESRSSTEVEDINLRNSQGQRAQPERLQPEPLTNKAQLNIFKDAISELEEPADQKPKHHDTENLSFENSLDANQTILANSSKKEKTNKINSNSADINQLYSELRSAVDILSTDTNNSGNKDNQFAENSEQSNYLRSINENISPVKNSHEKSSLKNRSKPNLKQNRKQDLPNSNAQKNERLQPEVTPKVTIGQIDVIVTAAPDANTDAVEARSSGFSNSSFSNSGFSTNSSSSSKSYSRRI